MDYENKKKIWGIERGKARKAYGIFVWMVREAEGKS